jgi:hypothetical protein
VIILAATGQHLSPMVMQLEQFVSAAAVDADLMREHCEVLTFQAVDFRRYPQAFGLIQPLDQIEFPKTPDTSLLVFDPPITGAAGL